MEKFVTIFLITFLGLAFNAKYQVSCSDLSEDVTKILVRQARSFLDEGNKVMSSLENKMAERTVLMESSKSSYFGINYEICADIRDKLTEEKTLLLAGKQLYNEITNEYNQLTGCFVSESKYSCWAQIIQDLPKFLAKYKPLLACFVNNVYYTAEMIDYDVYTCFGVASPKPAAPPKTFEQCLNDL